MPDLLESLAQLAAPPAPPPQFERQVHLRLNRRLLAGQAIEFVCLVIPFATWHFLQAVAAGAWYTLTGQYPAKDQPPPTDPNTDFRSDDSRSTGDM